MNFQINDSKVWATTLHNLNILSGKHMCNKYGRDAANAVSELTGNVVLCGAPIELFSDKILTFNQDVGGADDLRPIDMLYGRYCADTKTIEIFVENIRRDCALFGDFEDLLYLVRVHEHAHAVIHLGVAENYLLETLDNLDEVGVTDWKSFTESRTNRFHEIDSPSHEFLAQAITYAVATQNPVGHRADRLTNTFLTLEKRQPEGYKIPEDVKKAITATNWPMLLDAARGIPEIPQSPDFDLVSGLRELVLQMHESGQPSHLKNCNWSIDFTDDLAISSLKSALVVHNISNKRMPENSFQFLLERYNGLKIEIFAREHPPPHFRVIVGGKTANYRIKDCFPLNGKPSRELRAVQKWHSENKSKLIDAWNKLRPSDCPVGEYRED